jgi:charged multivesicular body protein 7
VERVEDVLESLREEVGKVDEVSGILSEVGAVDQKALLDEGAVDDELEAMEREEREKVRRVEEERTRERLKEMDALAQIQKEQEREKQRAQDHDQREKQLQEGHNLPQNQSEKDQELEDMLSTSTERLRKLDIDDRLQREKDPLNRMSERVILESEPQSSQQQQQLVAEGAS